MAWTELVIVLVTAFLASLLSFLSGFGLGTILLPAFALVFPLEVAVVATAVVHIGNNLSKGVLLRSEADWSVVARFGLPATAAGLVGAILLVLLDARSIFSYEALGASRTVTLLGIVLGLLIVVFSLFEFLPWLRGLAVDRRWLSLGGVASGFFGGLSGHQGALRGVFLTKLGMEPRPYVATNAFCAILVDAGRLGVYALGAAAFGFAALEGREEWGLVGLALVAALIGAIVGNRLLGRVTIGQIRTVVGVLLVLTGALIAAGWV